MAESRPNIMVIITDQQRADFLAGQGFGIDTMPFLESLRPRGAWFKAAYTALPVCLPARISMLTGRFAKAHSMIANWSPVSGRRGTDMLEVLRNQGYELAMLGKNHTYATAEDYDIWRDYMHTSAPPIEGREEECKKFEEWMVDLAHWVSHEKNPFPLDLQFPPRIVSDTLSWLDQRDDRPFFAMVSFPEPHSPYQVPEPYFDMFPPDEVPPPVAGPEALADKNYQWRHQYGTIKHYHPEMDDIVGRYRSNYCGMLRLIDDQVKRLITSMEERGLLENTVVVYLTDHGEFCGEYGLYRKGLGVPQCSIRIPMFWFGGPVQPCDGYHPAHVSVVDIFPTVCEAVGVPIPAGVQGRSLWPLLRGEPYSEKEFSSIFVEEGVGGKVLDESDHIEFGDKSETVYINGVARTNFDGTQMAMSGFRRALIKGQYKLIYDMDLPAEVYDLEADPMELNNLADDPAIADVKQDLMNELLYWSVRSEDNVQVHRYTPKMPPHNWYR